LRFAKIAKILGKLLKYWKMEKFWGKNAKLCGKVLKLWVN